VPPFMNVEMRESVLLVSQIKFQSEKRKKNVRVEHRTMMDRTQKMGTKRER